MSHTHTYSYYAQAADETVWLPTMVSGSRVDVQRTVNTLSQGPVNRDTQPAEATRQHTHKFLRWRTLTWVMGRDTDLGVRYGLTGDYPGLVLGVEVPELMAETLGAVWTDESTHYHPYQWHQAGTATWSDEYGASGPPYSSTNRVPFEYYSTGEWTQYETTGFYTSSVSNTPWNTLPAAVVGDHTVVTEKPLLEFIRNIEVQLDGRFYISKDGNAVYESRYHRSG